MHKGQCCFYIGWCRLAQNLWIVPEATEASPVFGYCLKISLAVPWCCREPSTNNVAAATEQRSTLPSWSSGPYEGVDEPMFRIRPPIARGSLLQCVSQQWQQQQPEHGLKLHVLAIAVPCAGCYQEPSNRGSPDVACVALSQIWLPQPQVAACRLESESTELCCCEHIATGDV